MDGWVGGKKEGGGEGGVSTGSEGAPCPETKKLEYKQYLRQSFFYHIHTRIFFFCL